MSKDLRLEFKIKNNRILEQIEAAGFQNVNQFCKATPGVSPSELGRVINLKASPFNQRTGAWRPVVQRAARAMNVLPEHLFSEDLVERQVESNSFSIKADFGEARALLAPGGVRPDETLMLTEASEAVEGALDSLPWRERTVLRLRFGFEGGHGLTLEEIGRELNLTRGRIGQIEARGLRMLRNPHRARPLKAAAESIGAIR